MEKSLYLMLLSAFFILLLVRPVSASIAYTNYFETDGEKNLSVVYQYCYAEGHSCWFDNTYPYDSDFSSTVLKAKVDSGGFHSLQARERLKDNRLFDSVTTFILTYDIKTSFGSPPASFCYSGVTLFADNGNFYTFGVTCQNEIVVWENMGVTPLWSTGIYTSTYSHLTFNYSGGVMMVYGNGTAVATSSVISALNRNYVNAGIELITPQNLGGTTANVEFDNIILQRQPYWNPPAPPAPPLPPTTPPPPQVNIFLNQYVVIIAIILALGIGTASRVGGQDALIVFVTVVGILGLGLLLTPLIPSWGIIIVLIVASVLFATLFIGLIK